MAFLDLKPGWIFHLSVHIILIGLVPSHFARIDAHETPENEERREFPMGFNRTIAAFEKLKEYESKGVVEETEPRGIIGVQLYLDTGSGKETNLENSWDKLSPGGKWFFSVHGYLEGANSSPLKADSAFRAALFKVYPLVYIVHVSHFAVTTISYLVAVKKTSEVGKTIADKVKILIQKKLAKPEDVTCVGFSLGAQICGAAGGILKQRNVVIGKITGIDAAGPLFEGQSPGKTLDKSDAAYVELIHTAGGTLGLWKPVGHVDIYVNKGRPNQPGCLFTDIAAFTCSHLYARKFYLLSLRKELKAMKCESFNAFTGGLCPKAGEKQHCVIGPGKKNCPGGVYTIRWGPL